MTRTVGDALAEIESSHAGPQTAAFFDVDGTLLAGAGARFVMTDRMKRRDIGADEALDTLRAAVRHRTMSQEMMADLLRVEAIRWIGRTREDIDALGRELFEQNIRDLIYPEMREVVDAHRSRGHTVVLTSAAADYLVDTMATHLGVEHTICNRFLDLGGVMNGEVQEPAIWAGGKADAVTDFAAANEIALDRSFFYADGDEDAATMKVVGRPRPTNPQDELAAEAEQQAWPVLRLTSRGQGSAVRAAIGIASLAPISWVGVGLGLLGRNRRTTANFIAGNWPATLLATNGVKLNVVGAENADSARPAVFVFNHRNSFDPLIATSIVRRDFASIAPSRLAKDPIVATVGRLADITFIPREPEQARAAMGKVEAYLDDGLSVLVAPGGLTEERRRVGTFGTGAFRSAMRTGAPIVPIVIRNADLVAGRTAAVLNPGTVDVAVLAPIPTTDWTDQDLRARIVDVQDQFSRTLDDWPG